MTLEDIQQVTEIERESFPTMWPQTAYKRELQQNSMARYLVVGDRQRRPAPFAQAEPRAGSLLSRFRALFTGPPSAPPPAAPRDYLVGFLGLWFMLEECHVVTVAVRESQRRQGIGELLLITAVEMALAREQAVLTLECRVSNTGARSLYEEYGFRNVGVRKRYYTDNNEDALIMTTPPIHTPEYRLLFERLRDAHRDRRGSAQVVLPER